MRFRKYLQPCLPLLGQKTKKKFPSLFFSGWRLVRKITSKKQSPLQEYLKTVPSFEESQKKYCDPDYKNQQRISFSYFVKDHRGILALTLVLIVFYATATFIIPIIFRDFLHSLSYANHSSLLLGFKLFLGYAISYLIVNWIFYLSFRLGLIARRHCTKLLLNPLAINPKNSEERLISFYGQEIPKIQSAIEASPMFLLNLLISGACSTLLLWLNGWFGLFAIGVLIGSMLILHHLSKKSSVNADALNHVTQNRVEATSSILNSLITIIQSGLGCNAELILNDKRDHEHQSLSNYLRSLTEINLVVQMIPICLSMAIIIPGLILNGAINAATVFPSLLLISTVRSAMASLPDLIGIVIMGMSSMRTLPILESAPPTCPVDSALLSALAGHKVQLDALPTQVHALIEKLKKNLNVSYLSEIPWIFAGTILDNIVLFNNQSIDSKRILQAIAFSGLNEDIGLFPDGLHQQVGSSGSQISGGQCQRLALARAIYQQSDVIILHHAFSAIDPNIKERVAQAIMGKLWQNKIIILIDHDKCIIQYADSTLAIGSDNQFNFSLNAGYVCPEAPSNLMLKPIGDISAFIPTSSVKQATSIQAPSLSLRSVFPLLKGSFGILLLICVMALCKDTMLLIAEYLLATSSLKENMGSLAFSPIYVAIGLLLLSAIVAYQCIFRTLNTTIKLSTRIFRRFVTSLFIKQIDQTQSVATNLSASVHDQHIMDQSLGQKTINLLFATSTLIMMSVVISIILPTAAPLFVCMFLFMMWIGKYYRIAIRNLSFEVSQSSGHSMANIAEYVQGANYLNAKAITQDWLQLRAVPEAAYFDAVSETRQRIERWFSFKMELFGTAIFLATSLLIVRHYGTTAIAPLGLVLTYVSAVIATSGRVIRMLTDFDQDMVSVNKVVALIQDQDKPYLSLTFKDTDPIIKMNNLKFHYNGSAPPILTIDHLTIAKNEKIAVIGHSGSGKSTFIKLLTGCLTAQRGTVDVMGNAPNTFSGPNYNEVFRVIPQGNMLLPGPAYLSFFDARTDLSIIQETLGQFGVSPADCTMITSTNNLFERNDLFPKLTLASIVLSPAIIVILDEPTASMNISQAKWFIQTLLKIAHEKTIVMITHQWTLVPLFERNLTLENQQLSEAITEYV